ncbi:MAG: winged helix-turn-helix domain-containing protein, partial [Sphingobacterium sp.]|nr:winged helix-turn-helix domain-containing protein [Sphingobacterium sp.]
MGVYKFEVFTKTIEQNIKDGVFKAGYKLPSVRMLKEQYGLSISTVQSGYDYLVLSGLVDNVPKSGYYVRSQPLVSVSNQRKRRPVIRDATFKKHLGLTTRSNERGRLSEFNVAAPGDLLVPQKLL